MRERFFDRDDRAIELRHVTRKLLAERQRRRILQMRPADFHYMRPLLRFRIERVAQRLDRGHHLHDGFRGRHVHGGRERIVRRLRHVDVVVGMDGFFRAHFSARKLDRAVGNDLVDVHVRLRSGPGLPDA